MSHSAEDRLYPRIDLHRHLTGSVRLATILELADQHDLPLPRTLGALRPQRDRIAALDLSGDEAGWPAAPYREHFRRARDAGWRITVHAGEAAGPASVWAAIRVLGAERIGHATRVVEDGRLLDYMAEHRIGIECCLTSNVQTGAAADYARHPLRRFLERGLLATINTDAPVTSGITLERELTIAAPAAGLSAAQIQQAQENAVAVAFLGETERAAR